VIFAIFGVLDSVMSYDRYKYVLGLNESESSNFGGNRNANILISSNKTKIMPPENYVRHHVV
jgi:hypothetical protein